MTINDPCKQPNVAAQPPAEAVRQTPDSGNDVAPVDPTYRVSRLRAATQGVISVRWNDDISVAATEMLSHDYSQLAVINGPRNVKGIISWKTIAQRYLSCGGAIKVRECTETAQSVDLDAPLLDAITRIAECDYVLVQSAQNPMCGIVTAADLSLEFRQLSEPFLLIGEIERHVREILRPHLSEQEVAELCASNSDDRPIPNLRDLSMGELVRAVQHVDLWQRLQLSNVDQQTFARHLDEIRELRNKVMHFRLDSDNGEISGQIRFLRSFAGFVRKLYAPRI